MFIGLFFAYFSIIQSAKAVTIASLLVLTLVLSDVLLEYGPAEDQISMLREVFVAYTLLGCAFILLERFFLHYMESFGLQNIANSIKEGKKEKLTRTLIYGGGLLCRIYLQTISSASKQQDKRKIVGILDDNSLLCSLNVYGFNVLGNIDELEEILTQYPFDEIVIALRSTTDETRAKLREFGRTHHIVIREFTCQTAVLEPGDPKS